ncbi:MAG: hypothetical protein WKF55_14785 [Gemmatimonadaceae bacterium]
MSGQHSRFNAIQIGGGSSNDLVGISATPGASVGGKMISLEALEEIRVLVAPFDVRQGGFSGGLINAATRSGTNQLRGSAFLSHSRAALVGRDTAGASTPTFNILQYGLSLGGPILRDRAHFFVVADLQARDATFAGPSTADPSTGISDSTAARARKVFRDTYGFDPGGSESPVINQPNRNIFVKLSAQPAQNHWLELSHSRANASSYVFNRLVRNLEDRQGWQLSNSGITQRSSSATTRLRVTSGFGEFTNELIASAGSIDDNRDSRIRTPLFLVQGDLSGRYLAAGSEKSAQRTAIEQRSIELTDNVSWHYGNHMITAGTQNQFLRDNFFLGAWGVWTFANVGALERREPSRYEVALPLREGGPLADYSANLLAGYLQDRWSVTPQFTLTGGRGSTSPSWIHLFATGRSLITHPSAISTRARFHREIVSSRRGLDSHGIIEARCSGAGWVGLPADHFSRGLRMPMQAPGWSRLY